MKHRENKKHTNHFKPVTLLCGNRSLATSLREDSHFSLKGKQMKKRTCEDLVGPPCVACQLIKDAKIQAELSKLDIKDVVDKLIEVGWRKVF